jgi:hypothetical protein
VQQIKKKAKIMRAIGNDEIYMPSASKAESRPLPR